MRFLNSLANIVTLLTLPAIVAYPIADIPDVPASLQCVSESHSPSYNESPNDLFSYDDILELIEEIEEGDIEERCSPEEIDGINRFMAMLAKRGIFHDDIVKDFTLNQDIEDLLSYDNSILGYSSSSIEYSVVPAIFYNNLMGIPCRSWCKKKWDQTRHFVKKHKKEIIIGAAIIAAVVVTVVVVSVVSASAAAAAAGTAIGGSSSLLDDSGTSKPPENRSHLREPETSNPTIESDIVSLVETTALMDVIDDQVNIFKDGVALDATINPKKALNENSPSFVQDAREFGAALAHKVFDGASEIVSVVPQLLEEIREIGERFVPNNICDFQPSDLLNPMGNYEFIVSKGHATIDQFFGVDQSQGYENPGTKQDFAYGIIPLPGMLGPRVATEGRIVMTEVSSVRGWSVGQPIHNRTFWGGVPKWSTVRQRYWKNEAHLAKSKPNHPHRAHIQRMERGLAPQRKNDFTGEIESLELHHTPPQREGGLFDFIEVWPEEHGLVDTYRRIGK